MSCTSNPDPVREALRAVLRTTGHEDPHEALLKIKGIATAALADSPLGRVVAFDVGGEREADHLGRDRGGDCAQCGARGNEPCALVEQIGEDEREWTLVERQGEAIVAGGAARKDLPIAVVPKSRFLAARELRQKYVDLLSEWERLREAMQQIIDAHDEEAGIAYGDDLEAHVLSTARAALGPRER